MRDVNTTADPEKALLLMATIDYRDELIRAMAETLRGAPAGSAKHKAWLHAQKIIRGEAK